jgi:hypothetical protein
MAPVKHPLLELVYNDEVARYVAMLERKVLVLTIRDMKMCALLELLTDEPWDDEHILAAEDKEIRRIAADSLQRRLGIPAPDAAKIVSERWNKHNKAAPDLNGTAKKVMPEDTSPPIAKKANDIATFSRPFGSEAQFDPDAVVRDYLKRRGHVSGVAPASPAKDS